ncbi:sugar phosphate isomerase/epimerase [Algoriphagus ratkowskyi]|uniref:Sugar phosphate isomerase/epimerase n=1 Tax=Algoriphagus ratkowskyi TaxID=57028 RepID=A0A2W7RCS5_9BACT|nr:sugar phosphate isomerase/epimerase [Algoriphagus ratkowskyi]PZX56926.1 sugar phosphate isomerase/epimerase [Algoriphagus ratkowskyi]TXD79838.1 sugar phosphate isomerase/epimerase [Algoriphagus ratkowskyi]
MFKNLFSSIITYLLISTSLFAQDALFPEMPGMVSYTYRDSFAKDLPSTLDTLQAMGITDMEFSSLFGRTASDIKKELDKRGMHCSSFGVSYKDLMEKTATVAENAKALGAEFVRVASIPHNAPFSLEDAQKTVADFNAVGKVLKEDFNLTFCYHNHGFEFEPYGDGTLFDLIIQETNPKYVSFEMDILWTFFPGADPASLLNKYGDRFKLMHLKDLRKGIVGNMSGGTPKENDVILGDGQLDIPAILKAAKKAGVQHFYLEDESPIYFLQVPKSIEYLHSLKK